MSRGAITEIEQARQKKQIEQTLEEASWNIPRLLKINARLVKEKHAQAEQIAELNKILSMSKPLSYLRAENQRLKECAEMGLEANAEKAKEIGRLKEELGMYKSEVKSTEGHQC